jgi:hypothetical protein
LTAGIGCRVEDVGIPDESNVVILERRTSSRKLESGFQGALQLDAHGSGVTTQLASAVNHEDDWSACCTYVLRRRNGGKRQKAQSDNRYRRPQRSGTDVHDLDTPMWPGVPDLLQSIPDLADTVTMAKVAASRTMIAATPADLSCFHRAP